MGTKIKERRPAKGLSSSEQQFKHISPTQAQSAAHSNSTRRVREIAIAVGFGVVGWALCGAVVGIGTQVVSMNTTLIIHAAAVPVIFGSLSVLLFKKFGATNPLQTAIVFLSVVITLDFFVVSLLIEGNFDMFKSVIGTWLPFALIFVTTYLCGAFVVAGRATGESEMIDAFAPTDRIKRAYNILSLGYAGFLSPLERKPRMIGLERAAIRPDDDVPEVAVGPGHSFVEILKTVDSDKTVCGVDLSPKMLAQTQRRSEAAGFANADLREADARQLPFPDEAFDVLYNSYMLDLIPLDDIPVVLSEFHRVLKQEGRLVLVNLSKENADNRSWLERLYLALPKSLIPYLMGGCRPVLMEQPVKNAGFMDVKREFVRHVIPSEIVTAVKPTADSGQ
jgi:demethylmenaquinone methyltransferase/2-methoxy-6-polyprenyl-1,4-benzoquinol methylase